MRKCITPDFSVTQELSSQKLTPCLPLKRHKCAMLITNTIRSHVFSRTCQPSLHTFSQEAPKCHNSFHAGQSMSNANHNDLSHPTVHSKQGVGSVGMSNDLDAVESSSQNTSAKGNILGLESTGPGFESTTARYESNRPETQYSSPGFEPYDVNVAKPLPGFESSQETDLIVPINQKKPEKSGEQITCS